MRRFHRHMPRKLVSYLFVAVISALCGLPSDAQVNVGLVSKKVAEARMKKIRENMLQYLAQARLQFAEKADALLSMYGRSKGTEGEVRVEIDLNNALCGGGGRKRYTFYFKNAQEARAFKASLDRADREMRRTVYSYYSSWDIPDRGQIDRMVDNWLSKYSIKPRMNKMPEHISESRKTMQGGIYANRGNTESLYEKTRGNFNKRSVTDNEAEEKNGYSGYATGSGYESVESMNSSWMEYQKERARKDAGTAGLTGTGFNVSHPRLHAVLTDEENTDDIPSGILGEGWRHAVMAFDVYGDENLSTHLGLCRKIEDVEAFMATEPLVNGYPLDDKSKELISSMVASLKELRYSDGQDGFLAHLYYDPESQSFCLSYAGTESFIDGLKLSADGRTNYETQMLMQESGQMDMAYHLSAMISSLPEDIRNGFSTTGHSLGGALSSMTAALTGIRCSTFNAEGIPDDVLHTYASRFARLTGRSEQDVVGEMYDNASRINAFYSADDVLSAGQDRNFRQVGETLARTVAGSSNSAVGYGVIAGGAAFAMATVSASPDVAARLVIGSVKPAMNISTGRAGVSALGKRMKIGRTYDAAGHGMGGVFRRMTQLKDVTDGCASTKRRSDAESRLKTAFNEISR